MSFRDKKTGRFVSKKKYQRSKRQGGTRYVKVRIKKTSRYILRASYIGKRPQKGRTTTKAEIHFIAPRGIDTEDFINAVSRWLGGDSLPRGWKEPELITWNGKDWDVSQEEIKLAAQRIILAGATVAVFENNRPRRDS